LLGIVEVIIQNFMELVRGTGSGPWVDRQLEMECDLCWKSEKCTDNEWYVTLIHSSSISEIMTLQQVVNVTHKLKPRLLFVFSCINP